MNLEEYKKWLEKKGNLEEREAFRVVEEILNYHQSNFKTYKIVQLFPRVKFKGMEFDLLIFLSDEVKPVEEKDYWDRLIGVEFKETDTKIVIKQAILRTEYVDYQYIATKNVYLDYPEIFLMTLFGIGWVVWGNNFAKLIVPARWKPHYEKINELVNYLINTRMEDLIKSVVNKSLKEFFK